MTAADPAPTSPTPAPGIPEESSPTPGPSSAAPQTPPSAAVAPGGAAVATVLRRAWRDMVTLNAALAILGVGVGVIWRGMPGLWGALLGVGVAIVFSGTTVWTMRRTVHATPVTTAAVVMGGWLAKMVVLIVILAVLRGQTFYDKWVFAAVLLAGVIGSALLDYRAVTRGRIPYVEPASTPGTEVHPRPGPDM